LLAVAKAFATGPKPKRSLVFIWHTGEEAGLNGSRYTADFPVVPLERVQAQLNMDMVGRDDCDNIEGDFSNTVFIVGADRISTDLHNLIVQTNASQMPKPLTLDYELNDPNDPEGVYTRSDHYSYAAKGIPIAFFDTLRRLSRCRTRWTRSRSRRWPASRNSSISRVRHELGTSSRADPRGQGDGFQYQA
jgi:Zn-dependent M28 family amino/carboxypeptidase